MALTSSANILANTINKEYILKTGLATTSSAKIHWTASGIPTAGTVSTAIGGATCNKNTTGSLAFYNSDVGKETKISTISLYSDIFSYFLLIDRLWECSVTTSGAVFDITSASPQIVNSITWPPRDNNESTNGEGVYIAVVSNGAWGTGSVDISMSYTNSSNISGRTSTTLSSFSANPTNGTVIFLGLQASDIGVKSVESITLTSTVPSGTFHLIAFRKICYYLQSNMINSVIGDFKSHPLPKLFNDSCLTFITQAQASAAQGQPFNGYIEYASG